MRWLICCLIFLLYSCSSNSDHASMTLNKADSAAEDLRNKRAFAQIDSVIKKIRSGDLVVRTGNDFTSESLRSLNQREG